MARPKLLALDLFAKTVEDAKVRTASGGLITLGCLLLVVLLLMSEYRQYRLVVVRPELVVDRDHHQKISLNVDVTFPHLPCEAFTFDILDVSGLEQLNVLDSGFKKTTLAPDGTPISTEAVDINTLLKDLTTGTRPDGLCGSCYGALKQDQNDATPPPEKVCCNDCRAVRKAYALAQWGFYDGEGIEQCENEGYVQHLRDNLHGGCRVQGLALLNRISGNFHFAPGASITGHGNHFHDLTLFTKYEDAFNFDHIINDLSCGPPLPLASDISSTHPLNGFEVDMDHKQHVYSYYLKVVPTRFEFLDGRPPVETNQMAVTKHDRPLDGGRDEDHPNSRHVKGGVPGVYFYFDMSPMKIINREQLAKSWLLFVLSVVLGIGGVVCLGAVLDRGVTVVNRFIKEKKDV